MKKSVTMMAMEMRMCSMCMVRHAHFQQLSNT